MKLIMPSTMEVASQHCDIIHHSSLIIHHSSLRSIERFRTLKAKCVMGLDWMGYTTTAVTPRSSLQSDANNNRSK